MKKNYAFIGPFGSGKTEIALNFAIKEVKKGKKVALADLDFVSPYFRSRDKEKLLRDYGIIPIFPQDRLKYADTPIIPPAVFGYLKNSEYTTILDIGGEEDGVAVVGYLGNYISSNTYFYFVVNTRRPFTQTPEEIADYVTRISKKARVKMDFIVNNTNLQNETTVEIIKEGERIIEKASEILKIPVVFTVVPESLKNFRGRFPTFVLKRYLKIDLW